MQTILVLVDFTAASSKALTYARTLASALGSQVILLHVVPLEIPVVAYGVEIPPIPLAPSVDTMHADQARLDELLSTLKQSGVKATAVQINGPLAETILNEASKSQADLIIMGSHHHGALYNLFVGSITADVLKHATFPILVVPDDAAASESP